MATEDARKLFVAGLPESVTEDVLRQLFEATGGSVLDVSLPKDRATGRLRGFGFVTMSSSDEATRARGALDGSLQAGRSISVRPFSSEPPRRGERDARAEPRAETSAPSASEDRTVYVGNLPYDGSQQELNELLTEAGVSGVARIHLPVGPEGRLRGFGFVTFQSAESANAAITALRERDVRGRRLIVNIAHPRGERGPGGPGGDRSRSARPSEGGWSSEPRFPTEPPMASEGARGGERRVRPAGEGDWSEEAKKKKKKGTKGATTTKTTEERRRGGGSSWRSWDDDD